MSLKAILSSQGSSPEPDHGKPSLKRPAPVAPAPKGERASKIRKKEEEKKPPVSKRPIPVSSNPKKNKKEDAQIWVEKYAPKNPGDLCVQKKKFEDVLQAIKRAFAGGLKLILLVGPPGSGKTACIDVICRTENIEKVNWTNPSRISYLDGKLDDCIYQEATLGPFIDFMKRQKYPALQFVTTSSAPKPTSKAPRQKKQIVVVEDMPNLHDLIQRQAFEQAVTTVCGPGAVSPWPVIFILSDTTKDDNTGTRLFGQFQNQTNMCTIRFNPAARVKMTSILKSICASEGRNFKDDFLNQIYEQSAGDIRNAINTLQFKTFDGKKSKTKKTDKEADEGRDISLSLFHSLGKVLYNKRLDDPHDVDEDTKQDPFYRPPMKSVPAEFQRHVHVDCAIFNEFVGENYLKFFGDIDDIAMAAGYLSDSFQIMNTREPWKKNQLEDISWYLSAHGVMFANTHPTHNKWNPLFKPHYQTIYKAQANNMKVLKDIFSPDRNLHNDTANALRINNLGADALAKYSWMSGGLVEDILPSVSQMLKFPKCQLKVVPNQKQFMFVMNEYSAKHSESQATRGSAQLTEFENYHQQNEDERRNPSKSTNYVDKEKELQRLNAMVLAEDDIVD